MTNKMVAAEIGTGRFKTGIVARGHALVADEPADAGGTDLGPTPYELLSASLASCSAITLRMYADRKGWPLEGVRVQVRHTKVHADDCDCETDAKGRIDLLEKEVELVGPLDDAQRRRLLQIADRCPVHRSLVGDIVIKTREGSPA